MTVRLIFLIDDDSISNFLNLRLLCTLNIAEEIQVFLNGQEAIDQLIILHKEKNQVPDLIILDLAMPIINGLEFLELFKNIPLPNKDGIKIVLMSVSLELTELEKNKLTGFLLMEKPLTREKVYQILNLNH